MDTQNQNNNITSAKKSLRPWLKLVILGSVILVSSILLLFTNSMIPMIGILIGIGLLVAGVFRFSESSKLTTTLLKEKEKTFSSLRIGILFVFIILVILSVILMSVWWSMGS